MTEVLLGIDCGSSVTKAALFDLDGREVGAASAATQTVALANGGAERSTDEIWESVVAAVRAVLSETDVRPGDVRGIGCSGHGNGLYALDARGRPLPTSYLSLDTRASGIVDDWVSQGFAEALYRDAWQQTWPGQPLPLLEWLRRNQPETHDRIATVLSCKDFVNYKLTGRPTSDFTDAGAAGLLANADLTYNRPYLESLGFGGLMAGLPALVASAEVIGPLTDVAARELGLPVSTPVVGGMLDVVASVVGSGGADDGTLGIVAGTWSINTVVTRQPIIDRRMLMTSSFADAERWIAIAASAASAANLNWFVAEAFVDDPALPSSDSVFARCCSIAATAEARLSSPIYHPFLYGSPTNAEARAGFYGVAGSHTRADLARAVLEGVVFGHRSHVDDLVDAGATADRARLTGGGARSTDWSQMFADVLGVPVEIPDAVETGARGDALAAGVGIGIWRNIDEAMATAAGVARTYQPNPDLAELYGRRYEVYGQLMEAMGPAWHALSADDSAP